MRQGAKYAAIAYSRFSDMPNCPISHAVCQKKTNNEYCSAPKCKNIIEANICNNTTLSPTFI